MHGHVRTLELPRSAEVIALAEKLGPLCEDEPMGVVMQALLGMLLTGLYCRLPPHICATMSAMPLQEVIALIFDIDLEQALTVVIPEASETVQ